ncbi:MAG TPA: SigE family RNA polymerase sigma factor [Acidothermaceae bacterium]|nr:SigE family RNA polymerase sigma factor [Acidothermaceae bacterium]
MAAPQPEFVLLVRTRSDALVRTARLLTGNWQTAEDLVQTALLRTWQHWDRLADPAAAEAYTRQIMARLSSTWWRRRWHGEVPTQTLPDAPDPRGGGGLAESVGVRTDVAAALAKLPPRQRATIVLRFYADLTEQQAADALGCSVGTVKSNTARGLAKLRELSGVPTPRFQPDDERA